MSCPDCISGGILPGEPTGTISTQGAYFAAAPAGSTGTSKRAILLLTDAFGLDLKNSKLLADNLSKELDCDVWVPDYFNGKPLVPLSYFELAPDRAGVRMTIFQWLRFIVKTIPTLPGVIANRPAVVDARLSHFVQTIKEEKKYEKLGAVGYCFGGSTAIRAGSTDLFQSVVICHPGLTSVGEIRAIKVPAAWVLAEDDMFFSKDLRLKAEAVFAERKGADNFIKYEFVDYKGTAHGFAARPNLEVPEVKEGHEKAFQQTVDWFKKTLPI